MMQNPQQNNSKNTPTPTESRVKRPDDNAGLNIDEHLRIFDPKTQEVLLEKRA